MKLTALMLLGVLTVFAAGEFSNRRAPGFSLMDTRFQQHDLGDYKGKVVIIDFMQTTCPVCNKLADTLATLKTKYGEKMAVLSVVTLPDNFQTADAFSGKHRAGWPILFDSGQVMMSYLKMRPDGPMDVHFPHVFIVDGSGTIRDDFDGTEELKLTAAGLSAEIDKFLK
jgi:peroxiredoxin